MNTVNDIIQAGLRKEINDLANERAELIGKLVEIRDLLRTGSIPDAFNMEPDQWAEYKCRRAAAMLSEALEAQP